MENKKSTSCMAPKDHTEFEEETLLKKMVASHPMFELLKEAHLSCLKVCLGDEDEVQAEPTKFDRRIYSGKHTISELDLFMEAYHMALVDLKKAIQGPMQEATAFIEFMHCWLAELDTHPPPSITSVDSLVEELGCELLVGRKGSVEALSEEVEKLAVRK